MIPRITCWCAILALTAVLATAQAARRRGNHMPQAPQTPADFAPDPVQPAPTPAPAASRPPQQPGVAPIAPAGAQAVQPNAQPAPAEQLPPPVPAQVTYRNGLLTVQATNSTLAGLLNAIRNKTGIQFEGLDSAASERVVISMGPSPEGEVLAAVLGGSKYDYVVLEREDSPGTVQRVLLSPRGGSTPGTAGGATSTPAAAAQSDDDDSADDAEPQDTPARPPLSQVQPQPQQPPQPQATSQPKTPEQLLEELRRMQQQAQQPNQAPQQTAPIKNPPNPQ